MKSTQKLRIAVIMGGESGEHKVSLLSGQKIMENLDSELFDTLPLGVDRLGRWFTLDQEAPLLNPSNPNDIELNPQHPVALIPGARHGHNLIDHHGNSMGRIDVAFPIVHGTLGEDGNLQGLLQMCHLPTVGCQALGSSIGMHKAVSRKMMAQANVAGVPFIELKSAKDDTLIKQAQKWGYPLFVKPSSQGSSVGVARATNEEELRDSINNAFALDDSVLIEPAVVGRELEIAVLETNGELQVSKVVGEIKCAEDSFYSYESKYLDENAAKLSIPAEVDEAMYDELASMAIRAFRGLELRGLARIDFLVSEAGEIYINEVNTLPGFTTISMYPALMTKESMSYSDLLSKLIYDGLSRHQASVKRFQAVRAHHQ